MHEKKYDECNEFTAEEFERLDAYADEISRLLESNAPRVDESMTKRVMDQLPCAHSSAAGRVLGSVYGFFDSDLVLSRLVHGITRASSCSTIFLAAGVFHLLYGLIIRAGLAHVPYAASMLPWWILLQPKLAYAVGLGLFTAGLCLRRLGPRAYRAAQVATLAYLALVVVNGAAILSTVHVSAMLLATVGLVGSGLIIGLFLGAVLLKCTEGGRHA
ncbi:hypothetical protein [Oceanidesulfovibrio indonesiensis]|uniref:hypothetical protein n=1 Tax=Oceanidesulfovibrio indonesiensis TaxID=54767 RepID=UPI0014315BC1|nr:hypothetical protein [Oceanidesulfovibrio indonesiensis]